MEDILPSYLAIGVGYERFMASCPSELKPFEQANVKRVKMRDSEMFAMSRYVYEAVLCAVDNALRGKNSKLTYRTQPFSDEYEMQKAESKAKAEQQRQLLINGLNVMKMRFEIAKMNKEVKENATGRS